MTTLLVGVGASLGAIARYEMGKIITKHTHTEFPWGTWSVNILGTLLLGVFYQVFLTVHHDEQWWLFLGTGFCGAFTTFSTMSYEVVQLFKTNRGMAVFYLGSSLCLGFILAWTTRWI